MLKIILFCSYLATAESASEHPLGSAVCTYCKEYFGTEKLGQCNDFKAVWGYGLLARVSNIECLVPDCGNDPSHIYSVLIGNRQWMLQNHLTIDDSIENSMAEHEQDGHTAVLVSIDGKVDIRQ